MARPKGPNPIDKHVGNRVRMRRLMLSMSQDFIAGQLGLTFQQVQKYEKGTNRISASRLQQLSEILGVSIAFFFEGAPQSSGLTKKAAAPSFDFVNEFLASADGLALCKAFIEIRNGRLRRSIVDMVERIAEAKDD